MQPFATRIMVNAAPVGVVLIEDHALTRAGLRTAIDGSPGLAVVGEAGDGIAGLAAVESVRPEVAVVDLGLPGLDGISLTREIRARVPATRIVILTMNDLDTEILAALAAGADAYCVKASDAEVIILAIRAVADGAAYFDPKVAHVVLRALGSPASLPKPEDSPLTPREVDVVRLIANGRGNGEIAETLHLGLGTVKGHIRDILEKLSAADRAQAAVMALRRGLI